LNIATLGASSEPRATARAPRTGSGTSVGSAGALPASVRISDGVLVYTTQGASPARYRVGKLDVTLEATGPPIGFKGRARPTPGDLALKIADGLLGIPSSHVLAEAPVRASVT